ncbi:DNA-binding transcriptional regulator [Spongiactinospora gelatinilytica]|uniref:DNA-binding transcriptional regulator n=1 Tax=Spongiactinospora gelatinilytica TaxID=2666298 RepID=A0A2W2I831_9ACTN|nr:WYL domain-containing protein [Spongiactinospora gelatinilytica]PZG54267.1 DNA-binding transcriptional regulator [Spongiactinospora gelatinilytica]
MSRRKTERLLNLVICLLATRRPLPADQIRQVVPGYDRDGDEAFQRMFERDKNELREIGIPIEVHKDPWDDEPGYRIVRQAYELPEITLAPDEAAVLGLAAQVWRRASLAEAAGGALLKLRAAGVETQESGMDALELRVDTRDPSFPALWEAVRDRRAVRFDYRTAGSGEARTRTVEPWGVVSRRGRWYIVGHDRDRDGHRVFRLSRITGPVTPLGRPGAVRVPPGVDLRELVGYRDDQAMPERTALLRLRPGTCQGVRHLARDVRPAGDGWDEADVVFADPERLAGWLASLGPDVEVVDPPDARDAVIRRLKGAMA